MAIESLLDYQISSVELRFGRVVQPGELNRELRDSGFVLHYDVYTKPRPDARDGAWQDEDLVDVELLKDGAEVYAQQACDGLRLTYPLAPLPKELSGEFLASIRDVQGRLGGEFYMSGERVSVEDVADAINDAIGELEEDGLHPGSESLMILIHLEHGR